MNNEIDLLNVLTLMRQLSFLSKFVLRDHQRQLIPNFSAYNVDSQKVYEDTKKDGAYYEMLELDSLAGFDPQMDEIDALIWAEITKDGEGAVVLTETSESRAPRRT